VSFPSLRRRLLVLRPRCRLLLAGLSTALLAPPVLLLWLLSAGRSTGFVGPHAMHAWTWLLCRAFGVRLKVEGRAPRGAFLFASNHLGYLDILVLGACYPSFFLSMLELRGWPLVGELARLVGTLFINRNARSDTGRVVAELRRELARGSAITLFPEAHPSRGKTVERFHAALFQAAIDEGVSCVPVTIRYECSGVSEPPSTAVCWWGAMSFGPHFHKLLAIPRIEAKVVLGEPVAPLPDRRDFANKVHDAVLAAFSPVRQEAADAAGGGSAAP
jgi:1-acyl-sn-glycerol-3-phosphate acyltransferase